MRTAFLALMFFRARAGRLLACGGMDGLLKSGVASSMKDLRSRVENRLIALSIWHADVICGSRAAWDLTRARIAKMAAGFNDPKKAHMYIFEDVACQPKRHRGYAIFWISCGWR